MSNIQVFCRIRPLNQKETALINYQINDQSLIFNEQTFTFDKILDKQSSQSDVYEQIGKPIIDQVMQGYNATLLMYGQTSSGKTYTMIGDQQQPGIIRRTIYDLFEAIESSPSECEFRIKMSIYEIYKERVKDLLDLTKQDLKIREIANQGFYIQSITQIWVSEKEEIFNALQKSIINRQVGQTNLNDVSSRSHLILQITIIMNNEIEGTSYTGQLIMADLAGSENASKAGTSGIALVEGAYINKSLLTLSNVINALSEKAQHIPFRESNLTKVLWNGLNKNSLTSLCITCSPCISNESETLSTLRFGIRAKMIKTQPKINKEITIKELEIQNGKLIKELEEKNFIIEQLKKDDKKTKTINLEEEVLQLKTEISQLKEQNSSLLNDLDLRVIDYSELQSGFKENLLEIEKLKNQLFQGNQQFQEFQQKQKDEKLQFNNQIEEKDLQIKQKNEKIDNLLKQIQLMEQGQQEANQLQLLNQIDDLNHNLQKQKLELKQLQQLHDNQVNVLTKQIENQEKEIEKLNNQIREYQLQIMKTNDEILSLTKQNNRLQKDLENRVIKVTELLEKYDIQQDQLNKLKRQMNEEEVGIYEENQKLHIQLQEINKRYVQEESLRRSQQMTQSKTLQAKINRIQYLEQENYSLKLEVQQSLILSQSTRSQSENDKQEINFPQFHSQISRIVKRQQ